MYCPHCGTSIPDNSNFCTHCGATTSQEVASPASSMEHTLQFGKLLEDTFRFCLRFPAIVLLVGLIAVGVPAIFEVCVAMTKDSLGYHTFGILNFIAACYAGVVAIRQCLHTARGNPGLLEGLMFPPFIMVLRMLGFVFIFFCAAFTIMLSAFFPAFGMTMIVGIASAGGGVIAFGTILVAGGMLVLWLSIRFALVDYYFVDQNMTIIDSMKESWKVSSGNFWALFGAFIVFLWPLFVMCAVCVYFIDTESVQGVLISSAVLLPFTAVAWLGPCLAYLHLIGQSNCLST